MFLIKILIMVHNMRKNIVKLMKNTDDFIMRTYSGGYYE